MKATALELTRALNKLRPECVVYIPCSMLDGQFETTDEISLKVLVETKEHQTALLVPGEGAWAKKDYSMPTPQGNKP